MTGLKPSTITVTNVGIAIFLSRIGPWRRAKFHKILDDAQRGAQTYNVPRGSEIAQRHRSLLYVTVDHERARRANEAAQAGFARQGMADALANIVTRMFYILILLFQGDCAGLLAALARAQAGPLRTSTTS